MDRKLASRLVQLSKIAYKSKTEAVNELSPRYEKVKFFSCGSTQAIGTVVGNKIFIAFRGTKVDIRKAKPETKLQKFIHWISGGKYCVDFGDIKTDIDFKKEDFYGMGLVHKGFKDAFQLSVEEIVYFIKQNKENDDTRIYICGHSLGGALAVLLAAYLEKFYSGFTSVYTYGQPRVFSSEAAGYQSELWNDRLFRFINSKDIVTRVPLYLQGFSHFGIVEFFDYSGKLHEDILFINRLWSVISDIIFHDILLLGGIKRIALKLGKKALADHYIEKYVQLVEDIQ